MSVAEVVEIAGRQNADMTPEERDRLTRLEQQYDSLNETTNDRFAAHHERANKLQIDYIEYEKRLRALESVISDYKASNRLVDGLDWERRLRAVEREQDRGALHSSINRAWWTGIAGLVGTAIGFVLTKLFGK